MSMSISIEQFQEQVKPLSKDYAEKYRELEALRTKFEVLVDSIELKNKHPDDDVSVTEFEGDAYQALVDAHEDEKMEVTDAISDLVYDFDLEWDGSFEEGVNSFWQPSTC